MLVLFWGISGPSENLETLLEWNMRPTLLTYFVHYCLFKHILVNFLVIQSKFWKSLGISEVKGSIKVHLISNISLSFPVFSDQLPSFLWDAHADITFLYLDTIVFLINRFPIYTFGTFAFLSDRNLTDIGKNTVNASTMWLTSFWSRSRIISYSCNKITTTWIQISRQNWNDMLP